MLKDLSKILHTAIQDAMLTHFDTLPEKNRLSIYGTLYDAVEYRDTENDHLPGKPLASSLEQSELLAWGSTYVRKKPKALAEVCAKENLIPIKVVPTWLSRAVASGDIVDDPARIPEPRPDGTASGDIVDDLARIPEPRPDGTIEFFFRDLLESADNFRKGTLTPSQIKIFERVMHYLDSTNEFPVRYQVQELMKGPEENDGRLGRQHMMQDPKRLYEAIQKVIFARFNTLGTDHFTSRLHEIICWRMHEDAGAPSLGTLSLSEWGNLYAQQHPGALVQAMNDRYTPYCVVPSTWQPDST